MFYNECMTQNVMNTQPNQIETQGLIKRFHTRPVLDGLDLTIRDGDLCVLVGDNGSGKTTLLRILAGLARADGGTCLLGGKLLADHPSLRRKIGYVGHQPMFYQDLTGLENLRHYAKLYMLPDIEAAVRQGILSSGLAAHQHKPVRFYSRGMLQRLSITRALLHDPHILLFDEPYTGLDGDAASHLNQRLHDLHQPGRSIIIAAHRPQGLMAFASHVAWLRDGQISHHLPIDAVSNTPEMLQYLGRG